MGYLRFFALLAVVGMACDSRAQGTKEVWLDELDLSCCIQDWGLPQADRSVLDTPLTVGGVVYGRGVGTHSISRMLFEMCIRDSSCDSLCRRSLERLENTLLVAQDEALEKSFLDSLAFATTELRLLTDNYLAFGTAAPEVPGPVLPDSVGVKWYNDEYVALYGRLTSAIKNYMTCLLYTSVA